MYFKSRLNTCCERKVELDMKEVILETVLLQPGAQSLDLDNSGVQAR